MSENFHDVLRARFIAGRDSFRHRSGEVVSYGELMRAVDRLTAELRARGVGPGERVALAAEKSWEAVAVYLATLKAGGIFVPLNPAYTAAELDYFLGDCEPALVVRDAPELLRNAPRHPPPSPTEPRSASDVAAIIYTSGTTGRSKGAMLTHGGLRANAEAVADSWGFTPSDVLLHALPIFHVHGLFIALHCALLSSCPMVWLAKFAEEDVLAEMGGASVLMGVPTFYTRLLAHPGFTREAAAGVRLFVCGSAPLLPSTFEAFEARTGKRILERYGMSEALVITSNPLEGERLAQCVGPPLKGTEVRIAGGEEVGGVEIRGDGVFAGYWRQAEKTAEAFTEDGFFITGDVGRLDAQGRLWLSGREKDLIITGGFNVYPKEIEQVLDELPGVAESAVVGLPHPDFGEAVTAIVVGEGEEGELIAAARQSLAAYKAPKRVVFVDQLPRNAMGKVQKNLLRTQFETLYAS